MPQLRDSELVLDRREGLWVYYRLQTELPKWVETVLQETWQANSEAPPFATDRQQLVDIPNRPGAACCA